MDSVQTPAQPRALPAGLLYSSDKCSIVLPVGNFGAHGRCGERRPDPRCTAGKLDITDKLLRFMFTAEVCASAPACREVAL